MGKYKNISNTASNVSLYKKSFRSFYRLICLRFLHFFTHFIGNFVLLKYLIYLFLLWYYRLTFIIQKKLLGKCRRTKQNISHLMHLLNAIRSCFLLSLISAHHFQKISICILVNFLYLCWIIMSSNLLYFWLVKGV